MVKCIIAGSRRFPSLGLNEPRDWQNHDLQQVIYDILLEEIIKSGFIIDTVISGRAWGMDQLGELWAERNNVPVECYPAEWRKYGKSAGFRRNAQMGKIGDCLICIHAEGSSGSLNMISNMRKLEKPVHVRIIR